MAQLRPLPSKYMKVNLPKTYSQNDARWKSKTLGSRGTIGDYGCLITDVAMMCTYFGHEETPETINDKLKRANGYVNGNLFVWGAISTIFPDIRYQGQVQTPDPLTKGQMDSIRKTIDNGYPVFLQIDTIPATSGLDEHWVLAIDYDGDDLIVQDPWDGATKRITSWGVAPQELIYAYGSYTGTPTVVVTPEQPHDGEGVFVDSQTFQNLVTKSTQWDSVAQNLQLDSSDATGGQKALSLINQLRAEIIAARAESGSSSQLQAAYNALQSQLTTLQTQYNALQQDYLRAQQLLSQGGQADPAAAQAFLELQNNYQEAQGTILALEVQVDQLKKTCVPQKNASTIPFWQSKKFIATTLTSIIPAALILIQTIDIKPGDDWQTVAVKLLSAAAAALGITAVGNQYVKSQGAIDEAEIARINTQNPF